MATTLFLGNNDESTHHQVSKLAQSQHTSNHGLIYDSEFVPTLSGYYHTTVVDIPWGGLLTLANRFDTVIMLDQPSNEWSHHKCFQATVKLMLKLESLGINTVFRNNNNVKKILYWWDLVYSQNKSFCIYPWINYHRNGKDLMLCSRDLKPVTTIDKFTTWSKDSSFVAIRDQMLQGNTFSDHCGACYQYEELGMESYRQFETMDWVSMLDLESIDDLAQIQKPH